MRTDLADVLAEVSTCITASMGIVGIVGIAGFLLHENLSTFGSSGISASAWGLSICPADLQWKLCSKVQEGPDPRKKSRSQNSVVTLHPTRTMGVWGLMRRTRGNQEVASASKDDLAIKQDEGNDQSIGKPVANYVAKQEHVCLGVWSVAGEVNTKQQCWCLIWFLSWRWLIRDYILNQEGWIAKPTSAWWLEWCWSKLPFFLILIFSIIRYHLSRHLDSSVLNVSPTVPDVKNNFLRNFDFFEHKR